MKDGWQLFRRNGQAMTGLLILAVSATVALGLKAARPRVTVAWPERRLFMLVGVLNAAAVLLMYGALARGPVGLVAPLVAVATGLAFGLSGVPMGVLYLMSATPVAGASAPYYHVTPGAAKKFYRVRL